MQRVLANRSLRRRGLVYAALLAISLILMAFSSTPVVGEVKGGLTFAFRPVQAVFADYAARAGRDEAELRRALGSLL